MKTITSIIHPAFALFMLACFALAPQARATCQEGCLTGSNTILGDDALISNTTGVNNTAVGFNALLNNTSGYGNTAIGWSALYGDTTGFQNTANGASALYSNTTGTDNTATGVHALSTNTTGNENTASGYNALILNTTGNENTAVGVFALLNNQTANGNMAAGANALFNNTTGNHNIALGANAGVNLTTGDDNIEIGNAGFAAESNTIRIGTAGTQTATFIAGIRDTPLANGGALAVGITADGQLGVRASSARFKEAIEPMDNLSEAIFSLQPVTFRYKKDPAALPQFGLVAEDVAKVNSHLVVTDAEGKPFTVRYDEINAMLLNEFLKEHKKVQELEANAAKQQKQIEALTAGLQKVSAQLELNKFAPQTLANSH